MTIFLHFSFYTQVHFRFLLSPPQPSLSRGAAAQCRPGWSYSHCVPTCPPRSCENALGYEASLRLCRDEPCVEGCEPDGGRACPVEGEVFASFANRTCVPASRCPRGSGGTAALWAGCLAPGGRRVREGELIEQVGCEKWLGFFLWRKYHFLDFFPVLQLLQQ